MARKEMDITCKVCNREFKTVGSFTGHLKTTHLPLNNTMISM